MTTANPKGHDGAQHLGDAVVPLRLGDEKYRQARPYRELYDDSQLLDSQLLDSLPATPWHEIKAKASMRNAVLSIDPGSSSGAIVVNSPTMEVPEILRLNTATDKDIADFIRSRARHCRLAVLEKVSAMPKQGVSSTFKFGVSYGGLRMALAWSGIPYVEVSPAKWQRQLGCLSKGDKNVTKAKAQQIFPELKVIHHTADALLLNHWGANYAIV